MKIKSFLCFLPEFIYLCDSHRFEWQPKTRITILVQFTMDKRYVIPESEEIKVRIENNFLTTGGASGETPDVPPGPGEE